MAHPPSASSRAKTKQALALLVLALASCLWAYWTTLAGAAQHWAFDPMYSHGYLVPGFALLLLWLRRGRLAEGSLHPSWWGLLPILGALGMWLAGTYFYRVWLEEISFLPCLAGLFIVVGGKPAWRWAWPAIGFLFFMVPLPYQVSAVLTGPLQQLATLASTFLLQTLALPALADGNVIRLNDQEINVVEACSGLRMLVVFFALATAVALVIRRPLWEKLVIVGSALPIALVVNVLRITATGVLFETLGSQWARAVCHDLAGWLMMPVGLLFLGLELKLLTRLVLEPPGARGQRSGAGRQLALHLSGPNRPPPRRKWQNTAPGNVG